MLSITRRSCATSVKLQSGRVYDFEPARAFLRQECNEILGRATERIAAKLASASFTSSASAALMARLTWAAISAGRLHSGTGSLVRKRTAVLCQSDPVAQDLRV